MSNLNNISKNNYDYKHYNDYIFKMTVQKHANGVLKFLKIPYKIKSIIQSEITSVSTKIHRLDFAGEVVKNGEEIILILECQTKLPTDDDIERFFQYIASMRVFKKRKVELYILLLSEAPYTKKEFIINDDCIYTMKVISLKHFKAKEILKNVEDKIKTNREITSDDIASLQLIAYTSYSETTFEILKNTYDLVKKLEINETDREAIIYILEVLSANMLEKGEKEKFMGEIEMMINPREEYLTNKVREETRKEVMEEARKEVNKAKKETKEAKKEIAKNLLNDGMSIEKVTKITGLTKKQIQNI